MKISFSPSWVSSKQPRKQRKYLHNAPHHIRHSFLSAHLSKELRKKHEMRSAPVRVGDEATIMRGSFAGKKGKITSVNRVKGTVILENITRQKRDGTKIGVPLKPSKLMLTSIHTEDKMRFKQDKTKEKKNNASDKSTNN
jgi:large subunit ribosomal protein L24